MAPGRKPGAIITKGDTLLNKRIASSGRSSIDNSLPFDCGSSCVIDFGLHCVACDARFAIQNTVEWKCSLALAQLILDIEKLRRKHAQHCSECNPGLAA
jgi:hypothetical protein